ncbi:hypothetical protein HDU93_007994 [Gonapodya sp. JEL0774]|nr:hypothetical protein HDU93_007994 [Gonapodya sp. JEL0774]
MSDAPFPSKLSSSRVLILGGTSGIGFAVASGCLASGARVHVSSSKPEKVARAVDRLRGIYSHLDASAVGGTPGDLADLDTMEAVLIKVLDAALDALGGPLDHIAVTSGDALNFVPLAKLTPAAIIASGTTRFFVLVVLGKILAANQGKYLTVSPASSVTFTGGTNSAKPGEGWALAAAYGAAKEGLVRGLSVDLAPIRINVVSPGAVPTELWGRFPEDFKERARMATTTKVLGAPEDVAEAYLYCMRDRFVVGKLIESDGGRLLV